MTSDIYCQQLQSLKQALHTKRPALLNRWGVIFQQDNVRPHNAQKTTKVEEFGWETPPYSPDIASSDFYLFKSLQPV